VTIPAGGIIALHHHQGTQVAYIQSTLLKTGAPPSTPNS
jgi:quercetin dioxygenase-like cupin family protein